MGCAAYGTHGRAKPGPYRERKRVEAEIGPAQRPDSGHRLQVDNSNREPAEVEVNVKGAEVGGCKARQRQDRCSRTTGCQADDRNMYNSTRENT